MKAFRSPKGEQAIVVSFEDQGIKKAGVPLEREGFEIRSEGKTLYITGKDPIGVMYGLLDIAETIELFGIEAVEDRVEKPFMKMRGIKFILPFELYDTWDPYEKNLETCRDIGFWRQYIDFLARNRYNCLSLWSEHPFHMMFRLDKYPQTCPFSDNMLSQNRNKELLFAEISKLLRQWLSDGCHSGGWKVPYAA